MARGCQASLGMLGWTFDQAGRLRRRSCARRACTALGDRAGPGSTQALAEIVLGFAARRTGDLDVAEKRLQALVDAARRQDEPVLYLSMVLVELGVRRWSSAVLDAASCTSRPSGSPRVRVGAGHVLGPGGACCLSADKIVAAHSWGLRLRPGCEGHLVSRPSSRHRTGCRCCTGCVGAASRRSRRGPSCRWTRLR